MAVQAPGPWTAGLKQPACLLTLPGCRRAVLNEAELLDYIRAEWDVDVVSTTFGGPLREAITLMQNTEVLVGMHGAGLTNTFWMRPGAVMVQLFPYGWQLENGDIIRTGLSRDMPLALNGSYFQVCMQLSVASFLRRLQEAWLASAVHHKCVAEISLYSFWSRTSSTQCHVVWGVPSSAL